MSVGQTWGLGKIGFGQVWDWVGLGWVRLSLGEIVRFGHIGIK